MNGDEVRNVEFYGGLYSAAEVNDLLERVAAELDAGRPAGPLIAKAMFRRRGRLKGRSGYDTDAVDWFLDQLQRREDPSEAARADTDPWRDLSADPWCFCREPGDPAVLIAAPWSDEYAADWRDFDRQPGTRLSWEVTGRSRREVRTADQQAIASVRYGPVEVFRLSSLSTVIQTISAGGRTFTMRRLPEDTWERIAGTIGCDRPVPAHMLRPQTDKMLRRQTDDICYSLRQLLDETGEPVLYTEGGRHKNYFAGSYIKFPDQRWLRFPVRGTNRGNAIMTAVDQAGNKVARYRFTGPRKEIAVHPDHRLTEELALVIAVSATWVGDYFIRPEDYSVSGG